MKVKVRLSEPIWRRVGSRRLVLELDDGAWTVAGLLDELERRYPGFATEVRDSQDMVPYSLVLNDSLVRLEQAGETAVNDGDELFVFLAVAGG